MTPPRPTVSVALCTCDGDTYLSEQLASLAAQTVRPDQIVILDDASADRTVPILRRWLAEPARACIDATLDVNPSRLGVRGNFEAAIRKCSGDLILLCDQDDVWKPDKIERTVALFTAQPDLLFAFSDADLIDADGRDLGLSLFKALAIGAPQRQAINEGDAFGALLRRNLATGAASAFRRTLMPHALPIPQDWLHDEWLAVIASCTGHMRADSERLIAYRQHGRNAIGARRRGISDLRRLWTEDRRAGNDYLYRRAQQLLQRLCSEEHPRPKHIEALRGKMAHLDRRRTLPSGRLRRVGRVAAEIWRGNYARYSPGWQSIVGDLLGRHA